MSRAGTPAVTPVANPVAAPVAAGRDDGAVAASGGDAGVEAAGGVAGLVAVRVQDAAVRLGGRPVWSGVSAMVRAGEFAAVLGPNGVGKSTLVRVILGVQPVAAGTVQVLGGPPGRARGAVGYLPQRRAFDPGLRIRGVAATVQVTGALLVFALLVLPACIWIGLSASYLLPSMPPSFSVIAAATAVFVAAARPWRRSRGGLR